MVERERAPPIDGHDWYVDRCGREVRYVIDYYFHEDKAGQPGQFDLVVRPAADSVESAGPADRPFTDTTCKKIPTFTLVSSVVIHSPPRMYVCMTQNHTCTPPQAKPYN